MSEISKKAIVIGATSGIGRAVAEHLVEQGYYVGITGRREELLKEFFARHPERTYFKTMDVGKPSEAVQLLIELIDELGGMDLIVISAGVGLLNPSLKWAGEKQTIDVNVSGFTAIADTAMVHFFKQGHGHLVGISSIAAFRGYGDAPAYYASKAYMSNYLDGLRFKAAKSKVPIYVTDIKPGLVDTPMIKGQEGMFWVAGPETAAKQIFRAVQKKKKRAYVTRRWRLIAWMMQTMPDFLYQRFWQ